MTKDVQYSWATINRELAREMALLKVNIANLVCTATQHDRHPVSWSHISEKMCSDGKARAEVVALSWPIVRVFDKHAQQHR